MNQKIARYFDEQRPQTPCLVLDLDIVRQNYADLVDALPDARIFYAVKANPAADVLKLLASMGSCFDTASVPEIQMALDAGCPAERISYGNTIKKEADIRRAFEMGVRLFAYDSEAELEKIARVAPGAKVFCRILTSGEGAEWPLSRKFGCDLPMARDLLVKAREMGVTPWGVSFHVGSQQKDLRQWDYAIAQVAELFRGLEAVGIELGMINLGGGFPTRYRSDVPATTAYGQAIFDSLRAHFGNRLPEAIVEPGRGMVGNAGVIESEVVLVSRKSANDPKRWVYLDIGKFGGLAETMDEAIQYPIQVLGEVANDDDEAVILAGPTCDSADVLYERAEYKMPANLKAGDRVRIHATGAYTTTYAAVCFNGFEPLQQICI